MEKRTDHLVLVVDDHEMVGALIVMGLCARGLRACRLPVTTPAQMLSIAAALGRGLVLVDLDLGVGIDDVPVDEIALIEGLDARGWRALVVSATTDQRRVAAAVAAGAVGFIPKTEPIETLLDVVAAAAEGHPVLAAQERDTWLGIHRRATAAARQRRTKLGRLTSREHEVLELLARGERAGAIAQEAVVSLTTVRSQIRSILIKLEVNSQLEAVALLRGDVQ
jgi:two-component system, NarL family, nitrate/nitrite response regulator NarL